MAAAMAEGEAEANQVAQSRVSAASLSLPQVASVPQQQQQVQRAQQAHRQSEPASADQTVQHRRAPPILARKKSWNQRRMERGNQQQQQQPQPQQQQQQKHAAEAEADVVEGMVEQPRVGLQAQPNDERFARSDEIDQRHARPQRPR
eukprot:5959972-Pleurochrysis_carterae.AAC.1